MKCSSDRIVIKRSIGFRPKRQFADPPFLSFEPFSEGKKDISFITGAAAATRPGNHRGCPFAIATPLQRCRSLFGAFLGYEAFI
jgi:hypothetical protein